MLSRVDALGFVHVWMEFQRRPSIGFLDFLIGNGFARCYAQAESFEKISAFWLWLNHLESERSAHGTGSDDPKRASKTQNVRPIPDMVPGC